MMLAASGDRFPHPNTMILSLEEDEDLASLCWLQSCNLKLCWTSGSDFFVPLRIESFGEKLLDGMQDIKHRLSVPQFCSVGPVA